ncbi:polymorphic toxin type 24 domain-containing protein [Shewanella sairae]|uniref:RHS repeat-associated core domain-containing protein n=1 Tax=Shewanella sairae TaxID=190310 RepID=UPI002010432C|nr:polymorphic toxin type 24 domain-containing protein [Shewanella sairae]
MQRVVKVYGTSYSVAGLALGTSTVEIQACYVNNKCGELNLAGTISRKTKIRYQHTDMLGTPVVETNEAGHVISRSTYEPFGKRLGGEKAGIGYTGHLQDPDLGLTYMQARYYDPLIGRFYSNDPVGTLGHLNGTQGIQGFNRYAYVNNNPYKYTDPDGKAAESYLNRPSGVSIQQNQDAYTGAAAIGVAVWTAGAAKVSVTASASLTALEVTSVATSDGLPVKSRSSRPAPLKKAEGRSHSIVEKSGKDGQYTTHNADGTFKQYRGSGKDHGNVPRPNVKTNEGNVNVNPKTGESFPGKTDVRPAKTEEIPGG